MQTNGFPHLHFSHFHSDFRRTPPRLTLEVVNSLVHLDGLPDRRPLLPAKEVTQIFEVVLILVKRFRHLADACAWGWSGRSAQQPRWK